MYLYNSSAKQYFKYKMSNGGFFYFYEKLCYQKALEKKKWLN